MYALACVVLYSPLFNTDYEYTYEYTGYSLATHGVQLGGERLAPMKRTASRANIGSSTAQNKTGHTSAESSYHDNSDPAEAATSDEQISALWQLVSESVAQLPPDTRREFEEDPWLFSRRRDELTRFLDAAKGRTTDAALSLLETARWRRNVGANTIVESWPVESNEASRVMRNYWPGAITGVSHDGLPVQVNRFRCVDFLGLRQRHLTKYAVRHSVYLLELAARWNPCGREIMIFDAGCSAEEERVLPMSSPVGLIHFLRTMAQSFRPNYPLHATKIFLVRVPSFFRAFWDLIRPFMPKWVESTLVISASIPMDRLLEVMPMNAIPHCLGGDSST